MSKKQCAMLCSRDVTLVYGRLGCSLMRELAQQVISTFSRSPRRGLTAENAYTHSMYRAAGAPTTACVCDPDDVLLHGCACNATPRGRAPARARA